MNPYRMSRTRILNLLTAATLTGIAFLASIDNTWIDVAPILRNVAIAAWVLLAIGVATDRVVAEINSLREEVDKHRVVDDVATLREEVNQLRAEIDTYGDQARVDGWIDHARTNGHTPPVSATPALKRIH